jgi:3-isopropylmalate dehydratase small subunit
MTVAPEGAAILLAGRNFGAGPRPSAASEAIAAFGVDCVICVSAEATFVECAANRGILTAIVAPEVADDLADAAMNREAMTVDVGARIITTALGERHAFTPAAMFNGARRADRRREDAGGHWFVPAFA